MASEASVGAAGGGQGLSSSLHTHSHSHTHCTLPPELPLVALWEP